jgi:hypothetical protein
MNKIQLLKKLEAILDEFERARNWGTIEIEMQDGAPRLIRKITTEKVESTGKETHANRFSR